MKVYPVIMSDLENALRTHPCYGDEAHHTCARMHLAVAPECNMQCNYCNRKYDCSNESRPGVTSEVLSPEQSIVKIKAVLKKLPNLKVIGIAGPGDPLANESTFKTLELVSSNFPNLSLCLSTNGLNLPTNERRLYDAGVRFITITMNTIDPSIGEKIYEYLTIRGETYSGKKGAEMLLNNQLEGIKNCVNLGMVVKINIVMIPGINDGDIPNIVKKVKDLGVYIVNILPLIPVEGTKFSNMKAPTSEERKKLMDICETDVKMMRHCKQCRADAIGLLDNDISKEFREPRSCGYSDIPILYNSSNFESVNCDNVLIAVATTDGKNVDSGLGNAINFNIYEVKGNEKVIIRTERIDTTSPVCGKSHVKHLEDIIKTIDDCDIIIVKEIGHLPMKILSSKSKKVHIADGDIDTAILVATK